jgi:hypothetical protein
LRAEFALVSGNFMLKPRIMTRGRFETFATFGMQGLISRVDLPIPNGTPFVIRRLARPDVRRRTALPAVAHVLERIWSPFTSRSIGSSSGRHKELDTWIVRGLSFAHGSEPESVAFGVFGFFFVSSIPAADRRWLAQGDRAGMFPRREFARRFDSSFAPGMAERSVFR